MFYFFQPGKTVLHKKMFALSMILAFGCQEDDLLDTVVNFADGKFSEDTIQKLADSGDVQKALIPVEVNSNCEKQVLDVFSTFGQDIVKSIGDQPQTSNDELSRLLSSASELAGMDSADVELAEGRSLQQVLLNFEKSLSGETVAPSPENLDDRVQATAKSFGLSDASADGTAQAVRKLVQRWDNGLPEDLMNGPCAQHFHAYNGIVNRLKDSWLQSE